MKTLVKMFHVLVCVALAGQLAGCGTLLHPERKGQKDGRIDPGIAVLDALGLLFFIIPGVIAFAIDFSNGTIYLPGTGTAADASGQKGIRVARFDPKRTTVAEIEEIVQRQTGRKVKLYRRDVEVSRLGSLEEMEKRLAEQG